MSLLAKHLSSGEIECTIKKILNSRKILGYDQFTNTNSKKDNDYTILSYTYNAMFHLSQYYTLTWEISEILFTSKSYRMCTNNSPNKNVSSYTYCSVSFISTRSKIVETILLKRLLLLANVQRGKNYSRYSV